MLLEMYATQNAFGSIAMTSLSALLTSKDKKINNHVSCDDW